MPTYNILGLNIFIPDLNEITQSVVGPIENFLVGLQQQIVVQVISSLSFLSNLGAQVANTVNAVLLPAVAQLVAPVQSFLQTLYNGILAIPSIVSSSIQGFFAQVVSVLNATGSQIQGFFQTYVVAPLQQAQNFIVSQFNAGLSSVQNFISGLRTDFITYLQQTASSLRQDFATAQNFVNSRITELQQNVAATNQFLSNSVNQLATNFQMSFSAFATGFATIGTGIIKALVQEIADLIPKVLDPLASTLNNVLLPITNAVKTELLQRLPRSPDEAINSAIAVAEVSFGAFVAGEIATISLEALYPTKHLGITEAMHKGLDVLGITAITSTLYGLIVTSGWKIRVEQYFNFNLQPHKIPVNTAREAVHYQVRTIEQFQTAMRYDGFDNDAIDAATKTIYKPLPPRMIVKLLDEEVLNDKFYTDMLLQGGLNPAYVADILAAFKFLALKSYAGTVKSLVSSTAKDGFLDTRVGNYILKAFGVPEDQIKWIFTLANLQYQYETRLLLKDTIIAELKKGAITAGEAVAELININMEPSRAAILVKLEAIKNAPTPSKEDRLNLAREVLGLPVVAA